MIGARATPRCSPRSPISSPPIRRSRSSTSPAAPARRCGPSADALPKRQSWRLVDNDLSLLARAQQAVGADVTVRAMPLDLAHDLEAALDGPVDLVTTSALLDLVSAEWLERLVTEIAARDLPVYAALSYDGRVALEPGRSRRTRRSSRRSTGISAPTRDSGRRSARRRPRPPSGCSSGSAMRSCRARRTGLFGRRTQIQAELLAGLAARGARDRRRRAAMSRLARRGGGSCSPRDARPCGSVTSIFSRVRPAGAEATGRSRTAPRRRAGRIARAAGSPDRHARSARACSPAGRSRG